MEAVEGRGQVEKIKEPRDLLGTGVTQYPIDRSPAWEGVYGAAFSLDKEDG